MIKPIEARPPAAAESFPCPECKGSGSVALLLSVRRCRNCGGRGRILGEPLASLPIARCEISVRLRTALKRLGVETVGHLARITTDQLRTNPHVNAQIVVEFRALLATLGIGRHPDDAP